MKANGWYRYMVSAGAFLERAQTALIAFKSDDDVQQLFVAALMARLGIEARLFEYIEAEIPTADRSVTMMKVGEYQATKLLARLTRLNPDARREVVIVLTPTEGGKQIGLRYTPVTASLASIHGRLGELLHFNYFKKNPYWYIADRVDSPGLPTVLHAQDLVERAIVELSEATCGNLRSHPHFKTAVEQVVHDVDAGLPLDS